MADDRAGGGARHRLRRLCVPVLVVVSAGLTACGASGGGSPNPFTAAGFLSVSGGAPGGISPEGITVRFVAGGTFGIALALRNNTRESVTVANVQTPEPPDSLVRQIGTRLGHWAPPRCPRYALGCPVRAFLAAPYGPVKATPITIGPGQMAGVQLNYHFVGCNDAPVSSTLSARLLAISFRYGNGTIRTQQLALAAIRLHLQRPSASECLRPHSQLMIEGPYATSSANAVVGGYGIFGGDTCTRTTAGGLQFQSAPLQSTRDGKPQLTVHFLIPRLARLGTYRTPSTSASLGPARIEVTTDTSGESTFPPLTSTVIVTHASATRLSGRLDAVVTAYRTAFGLHGTWSCTTLN